MPRYRFNGPTSQSITSLAVEVEPGDEFDSPEELNNPNFQLVEDSKPVTKEGK